MGCLLLLPYSRKIWRFGGLYYNRQIKIRQNVLLAYIRMAIPYRTAKFKSANILAIAILGSTAKFNARQYFWLCGILPRLDALEAKGSTRSTLKLGFRYLLVLRSPMGVVKTSLLYTSIWYYVIKADFDPSGATGRNVPI